MKINLARLREIAVSRNAEELAIEDDHIENGDLYRASVEIASKIRHAMNESDITEWDLAPRMGMDIEELERYLRGCEDMRLKMLVRFEKELGIHIIDRTIDPEYPEEYRRERIIVLQQAPLHNSYGKIGGKSEVEKSWLSRERPLKTVYCDREALHQPFSKHSVHSINNISI